MWRPRIFLSAISAAALLLAVLVAQVAAATIPETDPLVRVELDLPASNGFQAHLETSEKQVATLTLTRRSGGESSEATYKTQAVVTEEGLKVRFGRLGLIDVTFTPTTTLDSTEPGEGCTGRPRTLRQGVFAGTISFRGERGYVQIDGPQAEGSMSVIPPWECPEPEGLARFAAASQTSALRHRIGKKREVSATLYVARRHCSCLFVASVHKRGKKRGSAFYGERFEHRDGMEITRVTSVRGGAGAFVFDLAGGAATLRPPRRLGGHATFKQRPGPDLWQSTIEVPLLGADPLRTGATGYGALLLPEDQSD